MVDLVTGEPLAAVASRAEEESGQELEHVITQHRCMAGKIVHIWGLDQRVKDATPTDVLVINKLLTWELESRYEI